MMQYHYQGYKPIIAEIMQNWVSLRMILDELRKFMEFDLLGSAP
jgi:hypothetical protein